MPTLFNQFWKLSSSQLKDQLLLIKRVQVVKIHQAEGQKTLTWWRSSLNQIFWAFPSLVTFERSLQERLVKEAQEFNVLMPRPLFPDIHPTKGLIPAFVLGACKLIQPNAQLSFAGRSLHNTLKINSKLIIKDRTLRQEANTYGLSSIRSLPEQQMCLA